MLLCLFVCAHFLLLSIYTGIIKSNFCDVVAMAENFVAFFSCSVDVIDDGHHHLHHHHHHPQHIETSHYIRQSTWQGWANPHKDEQADTKVIIKSNGKGCQHPDIKQPSKIHKFWKFIYLDAHPHSCNKYEKYEKVGVEHWPSHPLI